VKKETGKPLKGREAERQTGMRLAGAADVVALI
jgi:hypothetical protein